MSGRPFYTMHKIMAGLLDMKTQAGNDQALDVVVKMAGWVDAWTAAKTEAHMQDILNTEYGGMNEVLYNLAAVTGDDRWARTGDRFTKKIFFTPLALRHDELKGQHMNTHVPQVIGAARRYELSSDYRFADVSRFFFETVSESRTYATGGSSNNEHWLTDPDHLAHRNAGQLASPGVLLLLQHDEAGAAPLRVGAATAGSSTTTSAILLNHRLGAIEPETGHTAYFLSLAPGAWKTTCTEDDSFWCCTGTGVEEFSKLNDTIYFHDDDSLFVNLYFASTVNWKERGVRLKQAHELSRERPHRAHNREDARERRGRFACAFRRGRLPKTSSPSTASAWKCRARPEAIWRLTRAWKAGDRVELTMPMRLTAEPLADDRTQQAFLYGPLVLAGQFPKAGLEEHLEHNQGPEIQEAPALSMCPSLKSSGADPGSLDQAGSWRSARVSHHRPGARRRPQAAEPKLATVCRLLDGIVAKAARPAAAWNGPESSNRPLRRPVARSQYFLEISPCILIQI